MPPLNVFIYAYMVDWPKDMTASDMKKNIDLMHKTLKQQPSLLRAIDERRPSRKQSPNGT